MNYRIVLFLVAIISLIAGCDQNMTTGPVSSDPTTSLAKSASMSGKGDISFKEAADYQKEKYVIVGYMAYSIEQSPILSRDGVQVTVKADLQVLSDNPKLETLYITKGSLDQISLDKKGVAYFQVMYPSKEGGFAVWISFQVTRKELLVEKVWLDDIKG